MGQNSNQQSLIKRSKKINPIIWEIGLVILILIISGVAHGYNMFRFPYFENDEGTYFGRIWSLLKFGKLAPYTYWYDHVPFGWIFSAFWPLITGGYYTFGETSNYSARVFMLVIHLLCALLLYDITKKIAKSKAAGILASIFFALSPLAIYFQRRFLLDNLMVFWMLLSIWFLLKNNLKLQHIYLSAFCFGLGVLTKEPMLFFFPAYLYYIFIRTKKSQRRFALMSFIFISGSIVSLYILYAFIKTELFPPEWFGQTVEKVNLINTLRFHSGRGNGLPFYNTNSDFIIMMKEWIVRDYLMVYLGMGAIVTSTILAIKNKEIRLILGITLFYFLFLMRGGFLLNFYVIPLIILWAIMIGFSLSKMIQKVSYSKIIYILLFILITLTITLNLFSNQRLGQFTKDETNYQLQTTKWIKENLHPNDFIVIDMPLFVDLRTARFEGDKIFPNTHWAWKVEKDPDVYEDILHNDWKNIDYIIVSHETLRQISQYEYLTLKEALEHSDEIITFSEGSSSFIDIDKFISTNGDWMSIYEIRSREDIMLDDLWSYYKQNFIISYGQVIDPLSEDRTSSEGQSYAMLRSVWEEDKATFDGVWAWTQDHMQHREKDNLLSWLWVKNNEGEYELGDSNSAADADQDIALALTFAYRQWGDKKYLEEAQKIINDIWKQEVVEINGNYYLIAGAGPIYQEGYLLNPSYVSPAHYRIFAEIDSEHNWEKLARDSYEYLNYLSKRNELPSDWNFLTTTGSIENANHIINESSKYSYDAMRIPWRIALDYNWFKTQLAFDYLTELDFFASEWENEKTIYDMYSLNGQALSKNESLAQYGNILSLFSIIDSEKADEIYQEKIIPEFINNPEEKIFYLGEENAYYDQNWVYFGLGLYFNKLENLWEISSNE